MSSPAPNSLIGQHFGPYRLLRLIGQGGMGEVYEAQHVEIDRRVAIKLLFAELTQGEFGERLLREAQAVNQVSHEGLLQVHDFLRARGRLGIVMELLTGSSLEARIEAQPTGLPLAHALRIGADIASTLAAVHRVGIAHRDLTPRNVMLVTGGAGGERVKILDFGIAKVTRTQNLTRQREDQEDLSQAGETIGSPRYMPPEQFMGLQSVGVRGDVYSLGIVLCELLSGKGPFSGTAMMLFRSPPPVPALPKQAPVAVRALLVRMLSLQATDRPDMEEVAAVLRQALRRSARVRAGLWGLLGLASVVVVGALAIHALPPSTRMQHPPVNRGTLRAQALRVLGDGAMASEPSLRAQVAAAIGATQMDELVPLLDRLLADGTPEVQVAAVHAAGALRSQRLHKPLQALRQGELGDALEVDVVAALSQGGDAAAHQDLETLSQQGKPRKRLLAKLRLCEQEEIAQCQALANDLRERSNGLPLEIELGMQSQLAKRGIESGQQWLEEKAGEKQPLAVRILAATGLAETGSDSERAQAGWKLLLEQTRRGEIAAAVAAMRLRQDLGLSLLLHWLSDQTKQAGSRALVATALGMGGALHAEEILYTLQTPLKDERPALRGLRVACAEAVLRLLLSEKDLDDKSLSLLSPKAADWMAFLDGESAPSEGDLATRYQQLGESDRVMLAGAALRLKLVRALGGLRQALDDSSQSVRLQAMASLGQLRRGIEGKQGTELTGELVAQLERWEQSGRPVDRVLAASLRAQLGDKQAARRLLDLYKTSNEPRLRELILESLPQQGEAVEAILVLGLADANRTLRFLAARGLADRGSRQGMATLQALLKEGGGLGLAAYALLRKLGEKPPAQDFVQALQGERALGARYQAVGALLWLTEDEAMPLLRAAFADPAEVVRRRCGEVSAAFHRRSQSGQTLAVLRGLLGDREPNVRRRALELLTELADAGLLAGSQRRTDTPAPVSVADPESPPGPEEKRTASPGTRGSAQEKKRLPPLAPSFVAALGIKKAAEAAEKKGDRIRALNLWESLLRLPAGQRNPSLTADAEQALRSLKLQLGSFRIHRLVHGACVPEASVRWGEPGDTWVNEYRLRVFLKKGQMKEVKTLCEP